MAKQHVLPEKPGRLFGRDADWNALAAFANRRAPRAMLGVVSGRRRMGKSYLLEALVEVQGGFYFEATNATATEALRQFGVALAEYTNALAPFAFDTWDEAIRRLFDLATPAHGDGPMLMVIDEFPYLSKAAPEVPSLIQREIDRFQTRENNARLLLCGSAMSVMGSLLAGSAPLRGRAQLELIVRPFEYRTAAEFWGVADDPVLAANLHSVVGGTPAYRGQFIDDDLPESFDDFGAWLGRTVLSPSSPLFREARYLLSEETDIRDIGLYHSVLAAIARGNTTRGGIANYIGRKAADISHQLHVLEDSHLLTREFDVFRSGRPCYRITEPLINFYEAIMRPKWRLLKRGDAADVGAGSAETFAAQVAGPHVETMCREYVFGPGRSLLNGALADVGGGVVVDPVARKQIQIDVAALEAGSGGRKAAVALLGEAKWGTVIGKPHLDRLRRARDVLTGRGLDTTDCVLACFSAAGFTEALREETAAQPDVHLIGLDELYGR